MLDVAGTINISATNANQLRSTLVPATTVFYPSNLESHYAVNMGGFLNAVYMATPTDTNSANSTQNPNLSNTFAAALYNRVRAVGGFISYSVNAFFTGQNFNVHWYIPFSTYVILFTHLGSTGTFGNPTLQNWGTQMTTLTIRIGGDAANAVALVQNMGAPSWGYYTYGVWQTATGTNNQYTSTGVTILGWAPIGSYNGFNVGVV
jgi:hypothetical protein